MGYTLFLMISRALQMKGIQQLPAKEFYNTWCIIFICQGYCCLQGASQALFNFYRIHSTWWWKL